MTKVLALAGGVGGAKLAVGLSQILPAENLSIIVNTGDDFIHYGLKICPDLDTVMYNLAGISNEEIGWGRNSDTWQCLVELEQMGCETWFQLGDKDIANHMERTRLLNCGKTLTEATEQLCQRFNVRNRIFPMTDETVSTMINTKEFGWIGFQEYFVKHKFMPHLIDIKYVGVDKALVCQETRAYIEEADLVIFCPSNPWLSIMPILAIDDFKSLIAKKTVIAVSPIVGHAAIKGPAAKIFQEREILPNAAEVAKLYKGIITGYVLDQQNIDECELIRGWGIIPMVTDTIMTDMDSKKRLAKEVLDFASQIG